VNSVMIGLFTDLFCSEGIRIAGGAIAVKIVGNGRIDNYIRFAPLADVLIPSNYNPVMNALVSLANESRRSKAAASLAGKMISALKAKVQTSILGIIRLTSQFVLAHFRINLLNCLAVIFYSN